MSIEGFDAHIQPTEEHEEGAVYMVPLENVHVAQKQERKISRDKVERHKARLRKYESDLLPIDAHELEDGSFIIDGNGRHRYFAYEELGYTLIPLNIKNREGFHPTKQERRRDAA